MSEAFIQKQFFSVEKMPEEIQKTASTEKREYFDPVRNFPSVPNIDFNAANVLGVKAQFVFNAEMLRYAIETAVKIDSP